jgi:hypothetical protein
LHDDHAFSLSKDDDDDRGVGTSPGKAKPSRRMTLGSMLRFPSAASSRDGGLGGSSHGGGLGSSSHGSGGHGGHDAFLHLEAIFDVFGDGGSAGGDLEGADDEEDWEDLTPEERTKRLLQKRGEDLKRLDQKMARTVEIAAEYKANAAKLKEETKKQAAKWPF